MTEDTKKNGTETEPIEPELMPRDKSIVRRPATAVTVDELAALQGEGVDIIQSRVTVLDTLRKASIKCTRPQDYVLFKAENRITAYLSDAGCQRVRPLWGIDIVPKGNPERVSAEDGSFAYSVKADGICRVTGRTVMDIEGLRYSTDAFCAGLNPIMTEMRVRQAATANRDGNIVRELTGLNSVPIEELKAAGLDTSLCALGNGFGSKAERFGAKVQQHAPTAKGVPVDAPECKVCHGPMKFIPAGNRKSDGAHYDAFWACPVKEHKSTMKDSVWLDQIDARAASMAEADREPGGDG